MPAGVVDRLTGCPTCQSLSAGLQHLQQHQRANISLHKGMRNPNPMRTTQRWQQKVTPHADEHSGGCTHSQRAAPAPPVGSTSAPCPCRMPRSRHPVGRYSLPPEGRFRLGTLCNRPHEPGRLERERRLMGVALLFLQRVCGNRGARDRHAAQQVTGSQACGGAPSDTR